MDRVRRQLGLTDGSISGQVGRQVTIAVLDSGIADHPDLRDSVLEFQDFTSHVRRTETGRQRGHDEYGHGTHVCGILCGNGAASEGRYRGICPGARLIVGKVLDHRGNGAAEEMMAGMEWVRRTQGEYGTKLLNISVGVESLRSKDKQKRLRDMMEELLESGILVVCAAGNKGPDQGTLSPLGDGESVVSVGCHDGAYFRGDPFRCEGHSGRGRYLQVPRKPDVVAPGTRITSCSAAWRMSGGRISYEARSGTSMAAPIVTGCLALALQADQRLTAKELKRLMISTATDLGESWNKQGWGMVNPLGMLERL